MDSKDRQIIRALQKDGRLTNQDLSRAVNLSPSPCLRRVRALEDAGIIKGYTALVDQKACGLPLTAFIRIRLSPHSKETVAAFEREIARLDEILDCFLMSGQVDYLLRVIAADLDAYEHFVRDKLHAIPSIASIDTSFAYGVLKQSRTYPLR
ncbi:MAG: Lrp/AsnC family transcriptional regulator [Brucellaceae bacterium]|nr:Lrp/AsnC family transcriptional regulator [Brucellaceae bacterium]